MVQWLRFHISTAGDTGLVQSLVRELRSHISYQAAQPKKKKRLPSRKLGLVSFSRDPNTICLQVCRSALFSVEGNYPDR